MKAESAFESWAPAESPWSPWVKPVLFAAGPAILPDAFDTEPWRTLSLGHLPRSADRIAAIIDLPGGPAVDFGLVAAQQGYRPVPLFNAVNGHNPVIDLTTIRHRLICDATNVQAMPLPADAPPCFLLDSRRQGAGPYVAPGYFDNRWVTLPQDFPSARFLQSQDINAVCLINQKGQPPLPDLAHVLHGWQKDGILISLLGLETGNPPQPITVTRPSYFGTLWYRWLALIGLRRHAGGGFGSTVPIPSSSSGGFG
jgi:hypothetical protein